MRLILKAATFDAAGTLFHLKEPVGATYARFGRECGLNLGESELDSGFRAAWKSAPALHSPTETEVTRDPEQAEIQWWRDLVDETFRHAGMTDPLPVPLFPALFEHYSEPCAWELFPETLESLDRLVSRFPLAVISNFDRRYHRIALGLGLSEYFQHVILSAEIGAAKPSSTIFRVASRALGCDPDAILHVGDDPANDWEGAAAAGFQVFRLQRPRLTLKDLCQSLD